MTANNVRTREFLSVIGQVVTNAISVCTGLFGMILGLGPTQKVHVTPREVFNRCTQIGQAYLYYKPGNIHSKISISEEI